MTVFVPVSQEAASLFCKYLSDYERVVILGAGGWFGKTAVAMLDKELLAERAFSFIGQTARTETVNTHQIEIELWRDELLAERQPELVIDFAFLTKDYARTWGITRFNKTNEAISARLMRIAKHDSVRCVLSASSGAAVNPRLDEFSDSKRDSYGDQKRANETELRKVSEWRGTTTSIARAWSVTGGFVRRPEIYAFSDFVDSVIRNNTINIHSNYPVFRRFCAVEDLIALSMAETDDGDFAVVESGGPLLEVRELAEVVSATIGTQSTLIHEPPRGSGGEDRYHSDNQSWSETARRHLLKPLDIEEQIQNVFEALKSRL
jgi:nucleoside-diphosphate-sugar epimerase